MNALPDDRILPATRLVAVLVVPILVLAFLILFLVPGQTGARFAWEIKPSMTAAYMGAGYLGGAWLFANAIFGRRWHRVAAGFPAVTAFTWAMLLVTVLHWERFDTGHFPFRLWLVLYVVTPFLVPWLWWRNRRADPGTPEPADPTVPRAARLAMRLLGGLLLVAGAIALVWPATISAIWPWTLTPLTARVLGGWFGLQGVGGLAIASDSRWSAWRVGLESIGLWQILILVGAVIYRADFAGGLLNWYLLSVLVVVLGMIALYARMESRRRARGPRDSALQPG